MARLTFANVNKALKDAGIDAEVVKNKGDFFVWFCGDEPSSWGLLVFSAISDGTKS